MATRAWFAAVYINLISSSNDIKGLSLAQLITDRAQFTIVCYLHTKDLEMKLLLLAAVCISITVAYPSRSKASADKHLVQSLLDALKNFKRDDIDIPLPTPPSSLPSQEDVEEIIDGLPTIKDFDLSKLQRPPDFPKVPEKFQLPKKFDDLLDQTFGEAFTTLCKRRAAGFPPPPPLMFLGMIPVLPLPPLPPPPPPPGAPPAPPPPPPPPGAPLLPPPGSPLFLILDQFAASFCEQILSKK